MTEQLYKVIFTGKTVAGVEPVDAKKNIASTFRLSPEIVERYFTGRPVTIKSSVDLKTAEKFRALFEKAGAVCSVTPQTPVAPPEAETKEAPAEKADDSAGKREAGSMPSAPAAEEKELKAESVSAAADKADNGPSESNIRVITPQPKAVSLQYTPQQCRSLAGTAEGLNFSRFGSENVPYSDIISVSVYNMPASIKPKVRIMIFLKSQKKPLTVDLDTISFEEIINDPYPDAFESLRQFIHGLSTTNSEVIIDSETDNFMSGNNPATLRRDETFHASSLGAALDAEGLFVLAPSNLKQKKTVSAIESEKETGQAEKDVPQYSEEEYLAMFVGPHSDKYLERFRRFSKDSGIQFEATWHWPAFFVPFFWLLYRKMYLYAIGMFAISFIPIVGLLSHVGMGLAAYYLYFRHATSSIDGLKRSSSPGEIAYRIEKEGGVNQAVVFIVAGILGFVVLIGIIAAILIPAFIKAKQEKVTEIINQAPMLPPGVQGVPGMPQTPEQAMGMAYDSMAMAELKNACTAAMVFFAEEHEGPLTMSTLERFGYRPRPEVDVQIVNPSPENLSMSARHNMGTKTIYADRDCRIN